MKAAYALGFLGLCAVVLVLHVYDTPEETAMQSDDPFLASLEAHVVAKAQRRLRAKDRQEASQAHISEARKAIKAALLDAQSSSLHQIKKAEEEKAIVKKKVVKKAKKGTKAAKTAKTAAPAKAAPGGAKQYTWDQLQRGEDAKQEIFTEKKVSGLLQNLKAAPHTDKSVGANTVVVGGADDEEIEQGTAQSEDKLSSALHAAKQSATEDKSEDDEEEEEEDEEPELAQVQAASVKAVQAVSVAAPSAAADDEDAFEDDEEFED